MRPQTIINKGIRYHVFNDVNIECSGTGCAFCEGDTDISFQLWENSVPFPMPPDGKRYRNSLAQSNRGKTIMEICYTCKEIPCYLCRRTKCPEWMKERNRKGQEKGCVYWRKGGRCAEFSCDKGLIKSSWESFCDEKTNKGNRK